MGGRNGLVFNIGSHIKSDASRAATYSKRKKGLLKKVKELSILCGVDVAVMCHHPHMAGASPLLWGQPNLDSVLNRYKGVAPEEREKRKLDNTTFLHNQVQKLVSDLHHVVDHNRNLANHLENALWDDRLNAFTPSELQQIAGQVLRKKNDVAELLAVSSATAEGPYNPLVPNFHHLNGYMGSTIPTSFVLHKNDAALPTQEVLMHEIICRMPAIRSTENGYMQSNVTIPNAALCRTPPMDEPAESENSIISGASSSHVKLSDAQSMFATKALAAVEALDDEFGPIAIEAQVDMAPTNWFSNTNSTASDASDTFSAEVAAQSHVKMPNFSTDINVFDFWTDGIGFPVPESVSATGLLMCQANQALQPEAALLVSHVN